MDTYKQICAKLVEAWDSTADGEYEDFGRAASYLVDWAREALAEPEIPSESPTDEELMALAVEIFDDPFATDKDYARAVLARWGSSSQTDPLTPRSSAA